MRHARRPRDFRVQCHEERTSDASSSKSRRQHDPNGTPLPCADPSAGAGSDSDSSSGFAARHIAAGCTDRDDRREARSACDGHVGAMRVTVMRSRRAGNDRQGQCNRHDRRTSRRSSRRYDGSQLLCSADSKSDRLDYAAGLSNRDDRRVTPRAHLPL